ncbi:hypothetical protein [Mucilaginibacter dorajii]|uniref:Tail fiber protein n=1 Tax=Mucilaginibacter dorajii TaxID=692994 RepID=A0ABP7P064_9SPHI|nr:hypothetical protein [Mucilaginibacter dorajii]MCS3735604.1 hypothetical protein [Mucilaginibacter dorajii]
MKNFLFPAVAVIVITTALSFNQKESPATSLGDVKYSILPPDQFKQMNGSGWVLLDGRKVNGSQLQKHFSMNNIPDARGMFLRGLNYDRQDDLIDPFFKEHHRVRVAGEYQGDIVGPHNHGWTGRDGNGYPNKSEQRWMNPTDDPTHENHYPVVSKNNYSTAGVGTETRPKNIALYVYIKIN